LQNARWLLALAALAGGAGLIVYRAAFLEKARKIGL